MKYPLYVAKVEFHDAGSAPVPACGRRRPSSAPCYCCFFFSSRRRHTRCYRDWSSDVCSSDLGRPAHLTRVHRALTVLPEDEQRRLGVTADWKNGPHLLTYRQTEYTFGLVADALGKDEPDGLPSPELQAVCDQLLEASVPDKFKDASASLAVDWTGLESFSRPPPRGTSDCADPEASWGHRKNNLLRSEDELFYGYYLSAG